MSGDYLGYLFTLASTTLLPIIVTRVAGARANAYFYLAWIIAYSLQPVAINMVASFTVEAAREDTQLPAFTMRVLRHTARLLLPAVGLLLLAAPYILRIYGDPYARGGTALLKLLALAAIPNIVIALYTGVARVQRRTDRIVLVQAALCIAVLGLTYLLLPRYGITGVGIAWLASESLLAAVLIAVLFRPFSWIGSSRE